MARERTKRLSGASTASERPRKVAIYIRVSTMHQVDRDSLPMQRKDLIAYTNLILGIEDYDIFEDAGYSGKNTDRPAFQDMMARVRRGEFSHILVWKIDRISRNLLDFAAMYKELQRLRVIFVSKNEQFDTSTAIGEAMLKIILVFAELERNMTSERVTATMISRANSGLWNGGRVPFGYNYNAETSEFSINEAEADICCLLKDDYLANNSLTQTSRMLNERGYRQRSGAEWSPTTVWLIAQSPFYAGIYRYNRYNGTENRTENPEEEWVLVENHHPAIFTLEEHEQLLALLEENSRQRNSIGKQCKRENIHVFGGLVYCGKCGSKMTSTPGRRHSDGYRASNYSCPKRRRSHECDNPTVSDVVVGEFVLNYILNMLRAKKSFSSIKSVDALEQSLLSGLTFKDVARIDADGLGDFYNLLSRYKSDDSFTFSQRQSKKKKAEVKPDLAKLRKEKEKEERALKRLQELYLYSDSTISEKDFIIRKKTICQRLEDINRQLGMINRSADGTLSDEEFIKVASHLVIQKELQEKDYIYYKKLAGSVSTEVLKTYMETILDSIFVSDGKIISITFRNGLTHRFIYKNTDDKNAARKD